MNIWLRSTPRKLRKPSDYRGSQSTRPLVIFNADDFGKSESVNRAILRGHEEGALTSASLIISAPAATQALAIARENPSLAIGLHLTLTEFPPVLPCRQVDRLVGRNGKMRFSPLLAGLHYASDPAALRQLRAEIRAQFERFCATGLTPSHIDGHMHMHIHPAIADQIMELAHRFGFCGVRLPRESILQALWPLSPGAPARMSRVAALHAVSELCSDMASRNHLRTVDRVYGIARSGQMDLPYVLKVLEGLVGAESLELIFHPDEVRGSQRLGSNPIDLATLISPQLRLQLRRLGIQPATYSALRQCPSNRTAA